MPKGLLSLEHFTEHVHDQQKVLGVVVLLKQLAVSVYDLLLELGVSLFDCMPIYLQFLRHVEKALARC